LHPFSVIPAEAGIQYFQAFKKFLDPGFHRGDDKEAIFSHLPFAKGGGGGFVKTESFFHTFRAGPESLALFTGYPLLRF
jgi:hypothetical protein